MGFYDNEKQDPTWGQRWVDENIKEYKEAIFDRLSILLIQKFSEIKPYIKGKELKNLQKTIRDQEIQVGIQSEDESIVLYESDTEANKEDTDIINHIVRHFQFIHPMHIDLKIDTDAASQENNVPNYIKIILENSSVEPLDITTLIGSKGLSDVKLKDNISQFIEIPIYKRNVNTNKLSEYIDITFTELKPKTGQ